MPLEVKDFRGRVTFITGPEKDCGKTSLLNACLALLRGAGEGEAASGGLAFMGVGFDGEARDAFSGQRKPRIEARAGEVFVTAEHYLRMTTCHPELLEVLPGSTALGRLAVARARRTGAVTIVGPERNDYAAWAIARMREEGWASTILVDGAINRITQVAAFAGSRFLFSLRASPSDLERQVRRVRLMAALQRLPCLAELGGRAAEPLLALDGPLTLESAGRVPAGVATLVVEDFTKVFLDGQALAAFTRNRALVLRERVDFGGFVVLLRDLSQESFRLALADEEAWNLVSFNPYEAGSVAFGGAA
jgi:hypothetical protein